MRVTPPSPAPSLVLRVARTGAPLATRCAVARSPWARLRGLLGRRSLQPGEALLLPRTRSVHTVGMRMAIDVVLLDGDDVVVRIAPALRPGRHAGARGARSVVELAPGAAAAADLRVGDAITRERGES